jgi:hypothetical protein
LTFIQFLRAIFIPFLLLVFFFVLYTLLRLAHSPLRRQMTLRQMALSKMTGPETRAGISGLANDQHDGIHNSKVLVLNDGTVTNEESSVH